MKKLCWIFAASSVGFGQIVTFSFDDTSTGQSSVEVASVVANGLSVSVFSLNSGTSLDNYTYTTDGPTGGNAVSEAGGWGTSTPSQYFSFTITPDADHEFDITTISFNYRVTSTAAQNFQIDVGSNTNEASGTLAASSSWTTESNSVTLTGLSDATEIRIYGYRDLDGSGGGTFGIDEIVITGAVSAVPEPSTYAALAGLAILGFAAYRRRQQLRYAAPLAA